MKINLEIDTGDNWNTVEAHLKIFTNILEKLDSLIERVQDNERTKQTDMQEVRDSTTI